MDFLGYKRSKHPFCKSIPSLTTNDFSKSSPCGPIPHNQTRPLIANVMQTQAAHSKAVPSRIKKLARALMPRQPYSEAVKSDGEERLHPSPFWKGRGLGSGLRIPSSQEGNRGVEKTILSMQYSKGTAHSQ